jgi:hypothetical protein
LYSSLASETGGATGITYLGGLSADDLNAKGVSTPAEQQQFYENDLFANNPNLERLWRQQGYTIVYAANLALAGLEKSEKLTPALKNQLRGEALFMRAFLYFNLTNLFGDIPYVTGTDYKINALVTRIPVEEVYNNIIADLLEAQGLLAIDYSYSQTATGIPERVRANKWAATALLARVYLYRENWSQAEEQSAAVINQAALFGLVDSLNAVFLKDSKEAIWQLLPATGKKYVNEGAFFVDALGSTATLSKVFLDAFEPGDRRKVNWVRTSSFGGKDSFYPYKYKDGLNSDTLREYYMVLRLAEQLLIRAEARAHQDKLTGPAGAASDIDSIRHRAGLPYTVATTQSGLLAAINKERRMELFVEWGHRWFDLKRRGEAGGVLSPPKPGWEATDELYPIPYSEMQLNPNMTQNRGY